MMCAGTGSGSFPVVPGNNSAQPLFSLNDALVHGLDYGLRSKRKATRRASPEGLPLRSRAQIRTKNLVSNILALMRSLFIVIRQPYAIDVIKLVKTHAKEMVQTLPFCLSDVTFAKRIRPGGAHWRPYTFHLLTLPKFTKSSTLFGIPIMDQMGSLKVQTLLWSELNIHNHWKIWLAGVCRFVAGWRAAATVFQQEQGRVAHVRRSKMEVGKYERAFCYGVSSRDSMSAKSL
jgi:hypothetical protein